MAQKRMFSKSITSSSEFLMMSQSAQNLYFQIGMNSDDDGFCEVFTIMRMTESKPDDLGILHSKGFIFVIDNKVCIVKDWHENNTLRSDRYKQSKYLSDPKIKDIYFIIMEEKVKDIEIYKQALESWQPNGNQMVPQYSIDKIRLDKISIEGEEEKTPTPIDKDKKNLSNKTLATPKQDAEDFFSLKDKQEEVIQGIIAKGVNENAARREIKAFISYWTELNKSGTKQKWESETHFEVAHRLATWFKNAAKFGTKGQKITEFIT